VLVLFFANTVISVILKAEARAAGQQLRGAAQVKQYFIVELCWDFIIVSQV
jgi:hypothetical protein